MEEYREFKKNKQTEQTQLIVLEMFFSLLSILKYSDTIVAAYF